MKKTILKTIKACVQEQLSLVVLCSLILLSAVMRQVLL